MASLRSAVVLLFAGAAIAPTEATIYAMVDRAAPPGSMTEAFAWLATAMEVGDRRRQQPAAGVVADRAGPGAAFAFAGGAGAVAVLVTLLRSRTISAEPAAVAGPARTAQQAA